MGAFAAAPEKDDDTGDDEGNRQELTHVQRQSGLEPDLVVLDEFDDKADAEQEEEEDADTPQSLEWFKKKTFRKVLAWVSVEAVGTVLVALGKRWGLLLALAALLFGCLSLYTYYRYNALLSNPALAKKGRAALFLGALLVVGLFVVAFIIADTTATL